MHSTQLTALITDLISQPTESEWVEFKENFHSAEEIGKLRRFLDGFRRNAEKSTV